MPLTTFLPNTTPIFFKSAHCSYLNGAPISRNRLKWVLISIYFQHTNWIGHLSQILFRHYSVTTKSIVHIYREKNQTIDWIVNAWHLIILELSIYNNSFSRRNEILYYGAKGVTFEWRVSKLFLTLKNLSNWI